MLLARRVAPSCTSLQRLSFVKTNLGPAATTFGRLVASISSLSSGFFTDLKSWSNFGRISVTKEDFTLQRGPKTQYYPHLSFIARFKGGWTGFEKMIGAHKTLLCGICLSSW